MNTEKKLAAFKTLMGELSVAVTEAVELLKKRGAGGDKLATTLAEMLGEVFEVQAGVIDALQELGERKDQREVAASLSKMVTLMEKRKGVDLSGLVDSIRQMRIEAPITVQPTPPTPLNVLPSEVKVQVVPARFNEWEVLKPDHRGDLQHVFTIRGKKAS